MHYNSRVPPAGHALTRPAVASLSACLAVALTIVSLGRATAQAPSTFAARIAALSEPGGYFDTDNLISNERSYLQVLPALRSANVLGGAYIGVGPDTNFTYIATVRPRIAFIVDIRRDNLLLHLLFKALFESSSTRAEYLAHLLGRPVPRAIDGWRMAPVERLVAYLDRAPLDSRALQALHDRVRHAIKRMGVSLSAEDFATIARFHQQFIDGGLDLRFQSTGRPPQYYYPTYRDLLLETEPSGAYGNYLASEESFQFVKSLQARHLVIPVVGDLGGTSAISAIARLLGSRGERLSAFYTSNVEFYLYGQGSFPAFVANLRQIPRTKNSVIIRSVFGRWVAPTRPRDGSSSHLQSVDDLISGTATGRFRSYGELVARAH